MSWPSSLRVCRKPTNSFSIACLPKSANQHKINQQKQSEITEMRAIFVKGFKQRNKQDLQWMYCFLFVIFPTCNSCCLAFTSVDTSWSMVSSCILLFLTISSRLLSSDLSCSISLFKVSWSRRTEDIYIQWCTRLYREIMLKAKQWSTHTCKQKEHPLHVDNKYKHQHLKVIRIIKTKTM